MPSINPARVLAAVGCLVLAPIIFVFCVFSSVGMARVAIAVARNQAVSLAGFISPPQLFLRSAGIATLISIGGGFVCVVVLGFVAITRAGGAKEHATIFGFLAGLAMFGFSFGLAWQLWGALFICVDDKGSVLGSIRAAQAIATRNKLTSFFIVLIAVILLLLGTLMCLVGHIVTAPLTMLLLAVAYLMMTGQEVSDPRDGTRRSC